jgi:hypothetical protein
MVTTDSFNEVHTKRVTAMLGPFLRALPPDQSAGMPAASTVLGRSLQVWTVSLASFRGAAGAPPTWGGIWHHQLQVLGLPAAGFARTMGHDVHAVPQLRSVYSSSLAGEIDRAFETPALQDGTGRVRLLEIHDVHLRALWLTTSGQPDTYVPLGRYAAGERPLQKAELVAKLPSRPVVGIALGGRVSDAA